MNLPKSLTTVTSLSKILATVLYVILPFVSFYLGMEYQKKVTLVIFIENGYNEKYSVEINGFTGKYIEGSRKKIE